MQAAGTLEVIAQIAVAFAGFTGLVGAFRSRGQEARSQLLAGRLLIEYSITILAIALLPVILWHLTSNENASWRVASALAATQSAFYYWRRGKELMAGARVFSTERLFYVFTTLDAFFIFVLLANAAGFSPWPASAVYLAALTYNVIGMGYVFLHFASPIWSMDESE